MAAEPSGLRGRRLIVTAGGTREAIDPVRFLGNRSSGRMGVALANEARRRGARVVLVSTADVPAVADVEVIAVESAAEMDAAVRSVLPSAAALLMAAAVADYRPQMVATRKLKKGESLTLELVRTVDILGGLRDDPLRDGVLMVGFAAETDDLEDNAMAKLVAKRLDLIVLNDVGRSDIGMGSEDNEVTILGAAGFRVHVSRRSKTAVAAAILDVVEARLPG